MSSGSADPVDAADAAEAAEAGRARRPVRRMPSPLVLAPIALAILAEAAWTAVLAGLLQT